MSASFCVASVASAASRANVADISSLSAITARLLDVSGLEELDKKGSVQPPHLLHPLERGIPSATGSAKEYREERNRAAHG